MKESITVHKLNEKGEEVWCYRGVLLERMGDHVVLQAYFDHDDLDFHNLQIRHGDRFIETFYNDRWYNVFAIHDVDDDRLKGWYCNIARPARIESDHVYADDLALDLIVTPEGELSVLDEEEFAALEISPKEHQKALETLAELMTMAAEKRGPFG